MIQFKLSITEYLVILALFMQQSHRATEVLWKLLVSKGAPEKAAKRFAKSFRHENGYSLYTGKFIAACHK